MCWYCGSAVVSDSPPGRSARCPDCGKDLRSCRNCAFFLSGSRGDCSEANAEHVPDKERGNFCDWFRLHPRLKQATAGEKNARDAATKARSSFDSLFGAAADDE